MENKKSLDSIISDCESRTNIMNKTLREICVDAEAYLETLPADNRDIYTLVSYLNNIVPNKEFREKGITMYFETNLRDLRSKVVNVHIELHEKHPVYNELLHKSLFRDNAIIFETKSTRIEHNKKNVLAISTVIPFTSELKDMTLSDVADKVVQNINKQVSRIEQCAQNILDFSEGRKSIAELYPNIETNLERIFEIEKDLNLLRTSVQHYSYAYEHNLITNEKGLFQKEILEIAAGKNKQSIDKESVKCAQEPVR